MTMIQRRRLLIFIVPGLAMIMAIFLLPIQALAQTATPTATATPTRSEEWTSNMVACWPMDEESGTREDIYGSNDLTDINTVGSSTGKFSNAANFDKTNSEYLYVVSNALKLPESFTISGWIYGGTSGEPMQIADNNGRLQVISAYNDIRFSNISRSYYGISDWFHIIVWFNSQTGETGISLNGQDVTGTSTADDGSGTFYIGKVSWNSYYLTGIIDELVIWSKALSSGDRYHLYNNGTGRSCYELIAQPTPTPTPTPSGSLQVGLSSGDWMTVQRQASYGDVALAIVGMAGLAVLILYLIVRLSKLWVN